MSDADSMDYLEFVDVGTALVEALRPRLSDHQEELLAGETEYGIQEPKYFMEDLVAALAHGQVPITSAERNTAVRLMRDQRMDLSVVSQFNIVDPTVSPEE